MWLCDVHIMEVMLCFWLVVVSYQNWLDCHQIWWEGETLANEQTNYLGPTTRKRGGSMRDEGWGMRDLCSMRDSIKMLSTPHHRENQSDWHIIASCTRRKNVKVCVISYQCQPNRHPSVNSILCCIASLCIRSMERVFSGWGWGDSGPGSNERGGIPQHRVNNFSNFRHAENPKQWDNIDNWSMILWN